MGHPSGVRGRRTGHPCDRDSHRIISCPMGGRTEWRRVVRRRTSGASPTGMGARPSGQSHEAVPGAGAGAVPRAAARAVPGAGTRAVPGAGARAVPGAGTRTVPGVWTRAVPGTGTRTEPRCRTATRHVRVFSGAAGANRLRDRHAAGRTGPGTPRRQGPRHDRPGPRRHARRLANRGGRRTDRRPVASAPLPDRRSRGPILWGKVASAVTSRLGTVRATSARVARRWSG